MKRSKLIGSAVVVLIGLGVWSMAEGFCVTEKRTFSENDAAILAASGTPLERMNAGVLLPSEERLLAQLNGAQAYMARRYPDTKFLFRQIDYSMPAGKNVTLIASAEETPEETFTVKVIGEKEPFEVWESYFSNLRRDEANALVKDAFAQIGVEAACNLEITGLYDDSYDPKQPLESLLAQGLEIPVSGFVYTAEEIDMEVAAGAVLDIGFSGVFTLRVVRGVSLQDALNMTRMEKAHIVQQKVIALPARMREVR